MKILSQTNPRQREGGMATIVFITLLAIMVLLATAESASLIRLHREIKFVEQQQIKRLNASLAHTALAPAPVVASSNSK